MNLQERIQSLEKWGENIRNISPDAKTSLFQNANNKNGWFTPDSCAQALDGILTWFRHGNLDNWLKPYSLSDSFSTQSVGLVMAGNIPLVGFHDFLCVLAAGHVARIKLSSQDDVLLPYLSDLLVKTDAQWTSQFSFEERLNSVNAVIATGSDNSARYFEYYFRDKPKIIRKNRTSVAVIMGEENSQEFQALAKDVFTFFGLGCRNVSKIYIPEGFDLKVLIESFQPYGKIIDHHKYANNYDYQKAIRLVSQKEFLDSGFFLLEKSEDLVSPISVIYYEAYTTQKNLTQLLTAKSDKIQCIVSAKAWYKESIPFGDAQTPALNDYADDVDTMKFLSNL